MDSIQQNKKHVRWTDQRPKSLMFEKPKLILKAKKIENKIKPID